MGARVSAFFSSALLLCVACAHPPARDEIEPARSADTQQIDACLKQPTSAALQAAAPEPAQRVFAQRVGCLETALTGEPLHAGNRVSLLVDGPATHQAQLDAIAKARDHVHLAVYIFTDDAVGQRYLASFERLHRRGVKVRVLVDAVGARGMGDDFQQRLQRAGVELCVAGPQNPAEDPEHWKLSHRNHRKLLIVDGRVAFTGGVNISDQYQQNPGASESSAGWRDTNLRVEGPIVAEFQKLFLDGWAESRAKVEPSPRYYPKLHDRGTELVRLVHHDGEDVSEVVLDSLAGVVSHKDRKQNDIYASYLVAMEEARQRIWITQAYFAPNRTFMDTLKAARARGVDVRLLVPGYTDIGTMLHASRWHYEGLLQAGVHVYEYSKPEAVLHAKTAVIDGVWATIGSSNLDYRSFIHNDEANAIVLGSSFASQMEQMYRDDLASSREIRLEEWKHRGLKERALENWSVLFKYWI